MTFGERVRNLRMLKKWTLRDLAPKVGVGFTYISKVENGRLDFGDYPSETLIRKLAEALEADVDELLLLAKKGDSSLISTRNEVTASRFGLES